MSLLLSETDRWKAWDTFLEARHETGFMQSSWWADFRATTGFEYFGVTLKDQGGVVGGALVTKLSCASDNCFYYIQDGPVLPNEEPAASQVFEAILDAIEKRRQAEKETISHLRIEPRWQRLPGFVRGFYRRVERVARWRGERAVPETHSRHRCRGDVRAPGWRGDRRARC